MDVRECVYNVGPDGFTSEWFELALDATTSVALTATRTSFPVHLRTTADASSPAPAGNWSNVGEVLDWLALVQPAHEGSLAAALEEAGRGRTSGELVVVTGTGLTRADRDRIWAEAENFDAVLLIQVGPEMPEQSQDDKVRTLWARDAESLVLGWVRMVSR
ncbi:MAG TPA: hypothetical protein VGX23_23040 [Actinocrinis sp.]|nr:hypothetical protein [Actinocrinis sp.]